MEKFIEISGQVYKMIGWGWELNMKALPDSFNKGRLKYFERYGKYPNHAYMHKDTIKLLLEIALSTQEFISEAVQINYEPPFNKFFGVSLEPESWVLPNLVYFDTEIIEND